MLRRLTILTTVLAVLFSLLAASVAAAQEDEATDEDEAVEVSYYGDTELIDTLRSYDLLDEWIAASPVSPQASLLLISGNGSYQAQREEFLNALDAWARRTELVRNDLARIDSAQADADALRSITNQVYDALLLDDRLAFGSQTLVEMDDALAQLAAVEIPQHSATPLEDSLTLAEVQLAELHEAIDIEVTALNAVEPAFSSAGIQAFVGYDDLQLGLNDVDQLIELGRDLVRPAQEESEQLVSVALAQIPSLHAARMVGSSDVDGLSLVTVDAYIRAASRASCSVDWALLAGIGKIESNHGRLGGASVFGSGQVSTTILGPLLDGGATARELDDVGQVDEEQSAAVEEVIQAAGRAARTAIEIAWRALLSGFADGALPAEEPGDQGNGFAVVVDSDNGRLDGNESWDRAIGPMQFLPETWTKWATDGNGDGVSDPHNLYDATAAAGRFLCDLRTRRGPSPSSFVLGYNSSRSYVRDVIAVAQTLRATSLPDTFTG